MCKKFLRYIRANKKMPEMNFWLLRQKATKLRYSRKKKIGIVLFYVFFQLDVVDGLFQTKLSTMVPYGESQGSQNCKIRKKKPLKNKIPLWWFGWMHDVRAQEHNVAGVAVNRGFCCCCHSRRHSLLHHTQSPPSSSSSSYSFGTWGCTWGLVFAP